MQSPLYFRLVMVARLHCGLTRERFFVLFFDCSLSSDDLDLCISLGGVFSAFLKGCYEVAVGKRTNVRTVQEKKNCSTVWKDFYFLKKN